jgi:FkbM family methyltransferase
MSEALLEHKTMASVWMENLLWFAGRFLRLIPAEARIRIPFGMNRGFTWIRGAANAPEWLGIYEYGKQKALRDLISPGMTVCDIGANAGFYTIALSRYVGPKGSVVAFEPLPQNLRKLRRHLDLNNIENVMVGECALADEKGTASFALGDSDFTGRLSHDGGGAFTVATVSLDEVIAEDQLTDPSFLKIDVEGAEAKVLLGARQLVQRSHPTMLIAIHGGSAARDCFSILQTGGYAITSLAGDAVENAEAMPSEIIARYRGER